MVQARAEVERHNVSSLTQNMDPDDALAEFGRQIKVFIYFCYIYIGSYVCIYINIDFTLGLQSSIFW